MITLYLEPSYLNGTGLSEEKDDPLYGPFQEFIGNAQQTFPTLSYEGFVEAAMRHELLVMELQSDNASHLVDEFWNTDSTFFPQKTNDRLMMLPWIQSETLLFLFEHYIEYGADFLDAFFSRLDMTIIDKLSTLWDHPLHLSPRARYTSTSFQAAMILCLTPNHPTLKQLPLSRMETYVQHWLEMQSNLFIPPAKRLIASGQVFMTLSGPFYKYDLNALLETESGRSQAGDASSLKENHGVYLRALFPDLDCSPSFTLHDAKLFVYRLLFCRHRYPRIYDGLREEYMKTLAPVYKTLSTRPYFQTALQDMYTYLIQKDVIVGSTLHHNDWLDARLQPNVDASSYFYNIFKNASDVGLRPALKFVYSGLEPASRFELLRHMDARCLQAIQASSAQFLSVMWPIADQLSLPYANFTTQSLAPRADLGHDYKLPFYRLLSQPALLELPSTELLMIWMHSAPLFNSSRGVVTAMDAAFLDTLMPSLRLEAAVAASRMADAIHNQSLSTTQLATLYDHISFPVFSHFEVELQKTLFLSPHLNVEVYRELTEASCELLWPALTPLDEPDLYLLISRLHPLEIFIGSEAGLTLSHLDRLLVQNPPHLSERVVSYFKLLFRERELGCSTFKASPTLSDCMSVDTSLATSLGNASSFSHS